MYNKIIITLVSILILYFLYQHYKITEQFEGLNPNNIAGDAINASATTNNVTNNATNNITNNATKTESCPSTGDWWDNGPIKAIRSKLWGASYNLVYQPDGSIKTPVLVPINNPESDAPAGCIAVSGTGWHQSEMCNEQAIDQRWLIVKIANENDFQQAIDNAKNKENTVGFTYGYKMDKVDYPFFLVVSAEHPGQALYYNGSALGVRPIGNYDDLKWDILMNEVKDPIVTNKFNYYSKLTPELQMSPSSVSSTAQSAPIGGSQNLLNNPQAIKALLADVLKQPNTNGEFGISSNNGGLKININMDDAVVSQLAGVNEPTSNNNTTVTEAFTNKVGSYPKKPMDIAVTLNYATSDLTGNSSSTNNNVNNVSGSVQVPIQEIDADGNLITIGKTEMRMTDSDGRKLCDESLCHPDMRDWMNKPYPCVGCVPSNNDNW